MCSTTFGATKELGRELGKLNAQQDKKTWKWWK